MQILIRLHARAHIERVIFQQVAQNTCERSIMVSPPQGPKPLGMEGRLVRDQNQQQHNQSCDAPRRAPGLVDGLLLRPRQPNHKPPVNKHVADHKDEDDRDEEEEKAQAELGLVHLGLVLGVPREGEEEHHDGKDGDQGGRREGEGGHGLPPPPLLPLGTSPATKEPPHVMLALCCLAMSFGEVLS